MSDVMFWIFGVGYMAAGIPASIQEYRTWREVRRMRHQVTSFEAFEEQFRNGE